jgi:hypothetical protein
MIRMDSPRVSITGLRGAHEERSKLRVILSAESKTVPGLLIGACAVLS